VKEKWSEMHIKGYVMQKVEDQGSRHTLPVSIDSSWANQRRPLPREEPERRGVLLHEHHITKRYNCKRKQRGEVRPVGLTYVK
jgi:hypothetical protein